MSSLNRTCAPPPHPLPTAKTTVYNLCLHRQLGLCCRVPGYSHDTCQVLFDTCQVPSTPSILLVFHFKQVHEELCSAVTYLSSDEDVTSVDDLLHHGDVAVGLLQLGGSGPDLSVRGDVLTSLVQHLAGVLVALQPCQRQPQL